MGAFRVEHPAIRNRANRQYTCLLKNEIESTINTTLIIMVMNDPLRIAEFSL